MDFTTDLVLGAIALLTEIGFYFLIQGVRAKYQRERGELKERES